MFSPPEWVPSYNILFTMAYLISDIVLETPAFRNMFFLWVRTVSLLINKFSEISLLVSPLAINLITSFSRLLKRSSFFFKIQIVLVKMENFLCKFIYHHTMRNVLRIQVTDI